MSRYLDRLRDLPAGAKNLERPRRPTDKTDETPEKGPSVSFGSTPSGPSQNFTRPPPLDAEAREAITEAIEERAAIREFDGNEERATAEHEARVAMRVYNVQVAMPDGPPKWAAMLAPGQDLEQARRSACHRFGPERVLRIEPANTPTRT